MDEQSTTYLERIDAAANRLLDLARPLHGLTDADPGSGEQWEAPQVWGHISEFVPYWIAQLRNVIDGYEGEPVPFGRTKADEGRLAGIEAGKSVEFSAHREAFQRHLTHLRSFVDSLDDAGFASVGLHPRLGPMPMDQMLEHFLVGHLEEHASQLEGLT